MSKKIIITLLMPAMLAVSGVAVAQTTDTIAADPEIVSSSSSTTIQFPVAELGNCADKKACKVYCDEPGNIEACVSFAEKNGLMKKEQVIQARKMAVLQKNGEMPGNCKSKGECEKYCSNTANIDECVAFAEKNQLMGQ